MNITVVGAGYVGMANAAALAIEAGHRVTVLDIDARRVAQVNAGRSTVADPGLLEVE